MFDPGGSVIEAFAFWSLHLSLALVAWVLLGAATRAGLTVLFAMACELLAFFSMFYPGMHFLDVFVPFAGVGLVLGMLLSIGRQRPEPWTLPAVAGSVLLVTQLTWIAIADWSDIRRILPLQGATLLGPPSGLWAGAALVRWVAETRRRRPHGVRTDGILSRRTRR